MNDRHGNPLSEAAEAQIRWHLMEASRIFEGGHPIPTTVAIPHPPDRSQGRILHLLEKEQGNGQEQKWWGADQLAASLQLNRATISRALSELGSRLEVRYMGRRRLYRLALPPPPSLPEETMDLWEKGVE